jgi:hypothetical protein
VTKTRGDKMHFGAPWIMYFVTTRTPKQSGFPTATVKG